MTQPGDRPSRLDPSPPPGRRGPSGPLLFVLVLTGAVMALAVLLVVWMYWLGGATPG